MYIELTPNASDSAIQTFGERLRGCLMSWSGLPNPAQAQPINQIRNWASIQFYFHIAEKFGPSHYHHLYFRRKLSKFHIFFFNFKQFMQLKTCNSFLVYKMKNLTLYYMLHCNKMSLPSKITQIVKTILRFPKVWRSNLHLKFLTE